MLIWLLLVFFIDRREGHCVGWNLQGRNQEALPVLHDLLRDVRVLRPFEAIVVIGFLLIEGTFDACNAVSVVNGAYYRLE